MILLGHNHTHLRTLADDTVACVVTSPPFWTAHGGEAWGGERSPTDYLDPWHALARDLARVLHPRGTLWLVLGSTLPLDTLRLFLAARWSLASLSAWDHTVVAQLHLMPGRAPLDALPPYTQALTDAPYAPLSRDFVRRCIVHSSRPGELVLDPCCGSGTVGVVALAARRRFVGIEINQDTYALAVARVGLQKLHGF